MANDGSIASLTEDWIVTEIRALSDFEDRHVDPFPGTEAPHGQQLIDELTTYGSPYVVVLFEGDRGELMQEGEFRYDAEYGVYVVVHNERTEGNARRGDDQHMGINKIRDLLRNALHKKHPNLGANGFWADQTMFTGVRVLMQTKDSFVLRAGVLVREVPQSS